MVFFWETAGAVETSSRVDKMKSFESLFQRLPELTVSAPGRVNLLGEHTDYNDGYVLPTAIPQRTYVQIARSTDTQYQVYAENLDELQRFYIEEAVPHGFVKYVFGCIALLINKGYRIEPVQMHVRSDVPIGAGLSSSAAIEVAVLRALRALFKLELDDVEIAKIAQQAEIEFAHVHVGIMDQMASSLADTAHMLFIDTRTLSRRLVMLPVDTAVVVVDSGVPRQLSTSVYNRRRAECEAAARMLGVAALRDVSDIASVEALPEPLLRRARHVVSENQRVLDAIQSESAGKFGVLMDQSHYSLRDDYEVSIPQLDVLADIMRNTPGVYGARLTGAGFGGCCVCLVNVHHVNDAVRNIVTHYNQRGHRGTVVVPQL